MEDHLSAYEILKSKLLMLNSNGYSKDSRRSEGDKILDLFDMGIETP